jgi:di/tricarboxylate transporter
MVLGEGLQIAVVLALVVIVFFGFVREVMAPDIVALAAVSLLLATGILSAGEFFQVFSNGAPITVAAMFVLSAALERTGVVDAMGRYISRAARWGAPAALSMMMLMVMALSAFINNTPVVVLLTPVVVVLAQSLGIAASRLLIPLSFAAIFGGTTTLIGTSTNLLVDGVAQAQKLAPFGMFEITVPGIIMGLAGTLYLAIFGRWLLPSRHTLAELLPSPQQRNFMTDVLVPLGSPLIGKRLEEAGFTPARGLTVVDVVRGETSYQTDLTGVVLEAGDRIIVRSKMGDMLALREAGDVAFGAPKGHAFEPIMARELVVMEGIVGPQSRLAGRRISRLYMRRLYRTQVLAVHRHGHNLGMNFDQLRLETGDSVLLEGPPEGIRRLFDDQELINIAAPADRPMRRHKAPIAIAAVLAVMALSVLEVLPIAALAVMAATAVVALRCLEPDEAYGSIRWNLLMLIFAMLALGLAMEKTGAAKLIVDNVASLIGGFGPLAVLALVYLVTSLLTEIMSNNATAILLTPIAIGLAGQLGVDPRPFVVAVMFAASASFATPIGYQTNTFVYSAGGYRFSDFVKVGAPLNLLMWALSMVLIPMFWPL